MSEFSDQTCPSRAHPNRLRRTISLLAFGVIVFAVSLAFVQVQTISTRENNFDSNNFLSVRYDYGYPFDWLYRFDNSLAVTPAVVRYRFSPLGFLMTAGSLGVLLWGTYAFLRRAFGVLESKGKTRREKVGLWELFFITALAAVIFSTSRGNFGKTVLEPIGRFMSLETPTGMYDYHVRVGLVGFAFLIAVLCTSTQLAWLSLRAASSIRQRIGVGKIDSRAIKIE